jgi:hypothetical protein
MFHQEVFWGQLRKRGLPEQVEELTHMMSQSYCVSLQKELLSCIDFRIYRKSTVSPQHNTVCGGEFSVCCLGSPYKVRT